MGQTMATTSAKESVQSAIKDAPVVMFSKPYCPFCGMAESALRKEGVDPVIVDLTAIPKGRDIQNALGELTGRRTVPNVFIGGKSIGGGDETAKMQRSGMLRKLLRDAGALPK